MPFLFFCSHGFYLAMIGSKEASVLGPKLGLPGKDQMTTQEKDNEVLKMNYLLTAIC